MKSSFACIAGALALGFFSTAAMAQTAGDGRPPVSPTESKQVGDWLVRCYPVNSPSPCDMFELLADKRSQQRILSISIAYVPSTDKHVIQIAVPLGVMIQKGVTLSSDTYTSPMLHYRRCDRGGCYVEMLMQNDVVGALGTNAGQAKIRVYADAGKAYDIPFSLKGFNDAHGAMQDLARKKTAGKAPAAPAAPAATTAPAPSDDSTPAPSNDTPAPTP